MKRWVVIETVGSGYNQKYAPPLIFFKRFRDAEKYLRGKIKAFIDLERQTYYDTIKEFLESNCLYNFETNEGEFFLEEVVFE